MYKSIATTELLPYLESRILFFEPIELMRKEYPFSEVRKSARRNRTIVTYCGNLLLYPAESITEYLIDKINSGYYILLNVNYCKLWGDNQNFTLHEVLIYGYDCEKSAFFHLFYIKGQFTQTTIDFEELQDAYSDAINYYKEDHNNIFWRRYWTYGIMPLRPKDYTPDTDHYFEFIREIRDEKTDVSIKRMSGMKLYRKKLQ